LLKTSIIKLSRYVNVPSSAKLASRTQGVA
jgi:hypothetical protein